MKRVTEAIVVGGLGATLGGVAGAPIGLVVPGAVIGGANGAISGARQTYSWGSSPRETAVGVLAFTLDSTWAQLTTTAGLFAEGVAWIRRDRTYAASLSRRQNRRVWGKGFQIRRGFATTFGNVICGAGDIERPGRATLITDHENVHVWQCRWFGPFFPVFYFTWMAGGAVIGSLAWLSGRRKCGFRGTVESYSYYLNPMEVWAYSRDGNWPPSSMGAKLGPKAPVVMPFSAKRARNA